MKSPFLSACMLTATLLAFSTGFARNATNYQPPKAADSYKTEAGGCTIPVSQFDMDINNVRARLLDAGDMWWDLSTAHYEVPKGDRTSGRQFPQAIFAGAIWISALDAGHNLKIAAQEYRQGTSDFFTGPIDNTGSITQASCNLWDQHFSVLGTEIKPIVDYITANTGSTTVPAALISSSVLNWPSKGNPVLAAKGFDVSGNLAPFFDNDGDGIYNPTHGDYPIIGVCSSECGSQINNKDDNAYADQMVFWVMNDKGNVHTATNGQALGVQINALAFAFQASDEVNNMTFYSYHIINKSGGIFNQTYMTQFVDPDLGCSENDRIGCDTLRSLGVVYNGILGTNTCDQGSACQSGSVGYGCELPMLGVDFFQGPTDTTRIPVPGHPGQYTCKKLGMSAFGYFTRTGGSTTGDPTTAAQFRNYQTGKWKDGQAFVYGGDGRTGANSSPFPFAFPGDPSNASQWSECNTQTATAIAAADRRFIQTSGPFTFMPDATQAITVGVLFVQPPGGVGSTCPSFSALATADDKAQALFDGCFKALTGPSAPLMDIRELENKVILNLKSDPAGNNSGEGYQATVPLYLRSGRGFIDTPASKAMDSLYKFQGYLVYQLKDATVTATSLNDKTKAVLIGEYDIQDNISKITNWELYKDPISGGKSWRPSTSIPSLPSSIISTDGVIKLANSGIAHSIVLTDDLIGGGKLVNHQTYYYGVLSFASNNFLPFLPDSAKGMVQPYLVGKNFNAYSAIPHSPIEANGGRTLNSDWGTGTNVKRIEGQGNGGNFCNLTPATIAAILGSPVSATDTLDHLPNFDPIGFKVTDPIALKEADFELSIHDTVPYNGVSTSTKAWWELKDLTNNKVIHSDRTLDQPYEQIVSSPDSNVDYGFSIRLGTPFPVYTNKFNNRPVYSAIAGGTITFKDPSKPWLSFIADTAVQNDVNNWIRSGTNQLVCVGGTSQDPLCNVFVGAYNHYPNTTSPTTYLLDPDNVFDKIAGGTWAPYCLASNWSQAPGAPNVTGRPLTVAGPAFKWDRFDDKACAPRNNLDKLQSVDIVITADKSKWTRCVVFETGENPPISGDDNGNGSITIPPRKGMLRNKYSLLDKNNVIYDPNASEVGRSWFPGYAINIETGQRLEMAFGEASDQGDQNGRDLIWNPTSKLFKDLNGGGPVPFDPILGGKHFIYVLRSPYRGGVDDLNQNGGAATQLTFTTEFLNMTGNPIGQPYPPDILAEYDSIMWVAMPYLTPGYTLASYANGIVPDGNDVTIKLRVQKPYAIDSTIASNNLINPINNRSFPRYQFSTKGLGVKDNLNAVAVSALDNIKIVPNPYLAYSAYENSANDGRIKITNLPNVCTIKIFTLEGVLVRTIQRAITTDPVTNKKIETSDGYYLGDRTGSINIDNTAEWDLKNDKAIPVSSGIYLFDIDAPGVGHRILKWFGAMRPTDVSNF